MAGRRRSDGSCPLHSAPSRRSAGRVLAWPAAQEIRHCKQKRERGGQLGGATRVPIAQAPVKHILCCNSRWHAPSLNRFPAHPTGRVLGEVRRVSNGSRGWASSVAGPMCVLSRASVRKRALKAGIRTMLRVSGSTLGGDADFGGPHAIRRIGPGPPESASLPKAEPETRSIVRIPALGALFRTLARLNKLRAGHGRCPPSTSSRESPPDTPKPTTCV